MSALRIALYVASLGKGTGQCVFMRELGGLQTETLNSGLEGLCVFILAERHMVCYRLDLEHWLLC